MNNHAIARVFSRMADLMEIEQENPFKVRAYRRAAEQVGNLTEHLAAIAERGDLESLPGIGKGIAAKIVEMVETGGCAEDEELRARLPEGLLELLAIPGLGPRKVALVYRERDIRTLDQLEAAARAGKLRDLPGMGERTEKNLVEAIERHRARSTRWPIGRALPYVETLVRELEATGACERVEIAGSLRRRQETVGDVDLIALPRDPEAALDAFTGLSEVKEVLKRGPAGCRVRTQAGIEVDLRLGEREQFGALLLHFTGSKAHNVRLRSLAGRRGAQISEYGVGKEGAEERLVAGESEEDVYRFLDLPWIPPELREDRGEIEAAQRGELPGLITEAAFRGVLHAHTDWSDGAASLREMAAEARDLGCAYLAITDHSKALGVARGLDEARLREQVAAIEALNAENPGVRVLKGIECDILADGTLDLDPALLAELDFVIGSVHSHFRQDEETMTARIVRALETGVVDLLAHPTGRLLGARDGYAVDLERVFAAAEAVGAALEINAYPDRLDLNDVYARAAAERGIPISINPDAHTRKHLSLLRYGVAQARRAWLTPEQVLNTWELERLLAWVRARRGAFAR